MASSREFPSNCPTNTVILQDFGEVAYIVCHVVDPPTSNAVQPPQTENTLMQLRQAEAQFRSASILAALEVESRQLFTFYKKVDVMKDQRNLLTKFGKISRNNSCSIAYKSAARAPELFKPENRKLRRLFITAILASVALTPQHNRQIIPLGQRYHAVKDKSSETLVGSSASTKWNLMRTDLQILQSGQVLLTLVPDAFRSLVTMSDFHSQRNVTQQNQQGQTLGVLAPFGQLVIYKGGWVGSWNGTTGQVNNISHISAARLQIWRKTLEFWARVDAEWPLEEVNDRLWVQLEVPRTLRSDGDALESNRWGLESVDSLEFKEIFWPADLCFVLQDAASSPSAASLGLADPVQFAQDWIESARERLSHMVENNVTEASQDDEAALFLDEGPFDNIEPFQPFGPPTFPASQTVYPTPPDVVMTHTTPGVSSMDGWAMTPANGPRISGEVPTAESQDLTMVDADHTHVAAVGSGYYEEDLFEEMPDDSFGQTGAGEEPNWDFFDKPDMDLDNADPKVDHDSSYGEDAGKELGYRAAGTDENEVEISSPAQQGVLGMSPSEQILSPIVEEESQHVVPGPLSSVHGTPQDIDPIKTSVQPPYHELSSDTRLRPGRRRSSIYEIAHPSMYSLERDSKYKAQGEFWFDTDSVPHSKYCSYDLAGWNRRTPSSSSSSGSSLTEDQVSVRAEDEKPSAVRQWTLFEPAMAPEDQQVVEVDADAIANETREMFDCLKTSSVTLSLESSIQVSKKHRLGGPKDRPEHALVLSQLFVEQFAQSTLLRSLQHGRVGDGDAKLHNNAWPDLTHLNTKAAYATVYQISGLGPPGGGRTSSERPIRLPERQIKFKRGEKDMMASMSIIPFWDTLGLQPHAKAKEVTAFCLHPPGSGIADGCASFLDRVADSYSSCNLGSHKTGKLGNLTDSGLLTWSMDREKNASLYSVATRLGECLALSPEISGTALIYIVSPSTEPESYIRCCIGFYLCYSTYRKRMNVRTEHLELVLQVVPASFVASQETIVVPGQLDYNSLVLEVYSRLPPSDLRSPAGASDFPMVLADETDSVHFSLETSSLSPLTRDGACLHLAYSYTNDQRWAVACWSDETGLLALTMTYLLSASVTENGRSQTDVIKDMWEVSQDLMKKERSRWRLIVARTGFYEPVETSGWTQVTNSEASEQKSLCTIQLVSVELAPTLQISTSNFPSKNGPLISASQPNHYGTPASTPQAITTSPEQMIPATPPPGGMSGVNASTPTEHGFDPNLDGDLSLTDAADESWALVLPFGVNQSHHVMEMRPALASGYLIKRLGAREEDGLATLGVHLIHPPPSVLGQREEVLEDIIRQFRGLFTLAVARGCVDKGKQCVPWHIHTVESGARGLSGLM